MPQLSATRKPSARPRCVVSCDEIRTADHTLTRRETNAQAKSACQCRVVGARRAISPMRRSLRPVGRTGRASAPPVAKSDGMRRRGTIETKEPTRKALEMPRHDPFEPLYPLFDSCRSVDDSLHRQNIVHAFNPLLKRCDFGVPRRLPFEMPPRLRAPLLLG